VLRTPMAPVSRLTEAGTRETRVRILNSIRHPRDYAPEVSKVPPGPSPFIPCFTASLRGILLKKTVWILSHAVTQRRSVEEGGLRLRGRDALDIPPPTRDSRLRTGRPETAPSGSKGDADSRYEIEDAETMDLTPLVLPRKSARSPSIGRRRECGVPLRSSGSSGTCLR
jgi:hypothetical protein